MSDDLVTVGSHVKAVLIDEFVTIVVIEVVGTHDDTILLTYHSTNLHEERGAGDTIVVNAVGQ